MIIDGKALAKKIEERVKSKLKSLSRKPKLAIVLVGEDPQSKIYVDLKVKKARELGIEVEVRQDLNTNADGIIVQLPTGEHLIDRIPSEKDVDGLTPNSKFLPATVKAIVTLLNCSTVKNLAMKQSDNRTIVVVGQGKIGKPIADYFAKTHEVIRCDEYTPDLKLETLKANILISATGVRNLITRDMVKPGAIVIDVGKDVDFEEVREVAGAITPPTGGVGPLTVISLLENLVDAVR